jgi:hypothetical protein
MLTLFAVPKAFRGHINIIQRNAITSWTRLHPRPEIILLGRDAGTAEVAQELNLIHIPDIEINEEGTPLLDSMFAVAQQQGQGSVFAYVNADIILFNDFLEAIDRLPFEQFMMAGQRWNLEVTEPIDFSQPDWVAQVQQRARTDGKLEGPQAIDYFVFPRGFYQDIPPFALGRTAWDNWMLLDVLRRKQQLIDATPSVMVVHQNHDYNHHPQGKFGVWAGPESESNLQLLGGWDYANFTLDLATWLLMPDGLKRPAWFGDNLDAYIDRIRLAQPQAAADPETFKQQWQEETQALEAVSIAPSG